MRVEKDRSSQGIWVFPKIGRKPPKWMVKIMENPIKQMDDLGGITTPIFGSTPIWMSRGYLCYALHKWVISLMKGVILGSPLNSYWEAIKTYKSWCLNGREQ